jgi:hypothetical protein
MSLSQLRSNLCELSFAKQINSENFVSSGKFLYYKNSLMWNRLSYLTLPEERETKLNQTLATVKDLLWKKIENLEQAKRSYYKELAASLKKERFNPKRLKAAEKIILTFNLYLKPFMKQVLHEEEKPYLAFMCSGKQKSLKELFSAVQLCRRLKDFSLVSKGEVPLQILLKISRDKDLRVSEEDKVKVWLKRVKASAGKKIPAFGPSIENNLVKAPFFHKLLLDLTGFFNESVLKKGEISDLGLLEARLISAGYKAFHEPDADFLCRRSRWNTGDLLEIGGKKYKLAEQLAAPRTNVSDPVIFAVVGRRDVEVVFPWTPSDPYLNHLEERSQQCGIVQAKVLGVGYRGAAILRERLYEPLSEIQWKSRGLHVSHPEDQRNLAPIIELLKGFLTQPFTPHPLALNHFAYNAAGEMRAAALLRPIHKSFEHLEKFAYECAYGSGDYFFQSIYRKIMLESGLGQCEEALAYHDVVRWALEERDEEASITLDGEITLTDILERRAQLYHEVRRIFAHLEGRVKRFYEIPDEGRFLAALGRAVLDTYFDRCPGSLLIPLVDFEELAYERYLYIEKPLMQEAFFERACKEIEEEMASADSLREDRRKRAYYRQKGIYHLGQAQKALDRGLAAFTSRHSMR